MNTAPTHSAVPGHIVSASPDLDEALWYKDAVIYQVNVKAFYDSNDDGIGDFKGLTSKLDYIKELGVNTIWLMPFYPSPLRDDGYDISDYHNVHPMYGTRHDFRIFLREAHRRGLKVITELVINHTSDTHPWFQAARRAPPGSIKRDYYVWSDDDQKYKGTRIIFTDTETSNWTWDPVAKAYYWHRFFSHQPDLNFDNPHVLKAVFRTMRFWLDMGVDGFRLDAIPYLIERDGTNNENLPETHQIIKQLRAAIDARYKNRFLLAEANQWPEDVREYFGNGDECHMCYHFPLMPRIYMSIAQEDRYPIIEIMQQTPEIPETCQWAIFLRNHDELTLEMVTSKERDYMYNTYAADPRARINLGIRRRLAPLMENDPDRVKLMNSLLLSMPGSPIIYYGDEIGMGDNVFVGDRNGVRTPMQWSPDRNAGFSRADPQRLYLPPIMDPVYGFQAVNVEAQSRAPSSLLNWTRRMLAVRNTSKAFGRGRRTYLKPGNRKILAYLSEYADDVILCVANMSRTAQPVELDLARFKGRVPVEMLGRVTFPPIGDLPYLLTLPAYGFYWFKLTVDAEMPQWHDERLPRDDRPVLVLFDGWNSLFRDQVVPWRIGLAEKTRAQFEHEAVPRYLETQRWYATKGDEVKRAALCDHAFWREGDTSWLLPLFELEGPQERSRYFMPLALAWEDHDEERLPNLVPAMVAKVRQQANVGVLADAFCDEAFCRAMVTAIGAGRELATARGKLYFKPTSAFGEIAGADLSKLPVGRPSAQSTNTVVTLDERLFLKGYRRIRPGVNLEFEVGRYLTEVVRYPNCVPVAGALEYVDHNGTISTLALVQAYVSNQGDGWDYTTAYLQRFLDERRTLDEPLPPDVHGAYMELMHTLGRRTAELHVAFARPSNDPAFNPEPLRREDVDTWRHQALEETRETFELLEANVSHLPQTALGEAKTLMARREQVTARIESCLRELPEQVLKTRYHGDYHLGQVLLTKNDFVIIDFEGEPARSFEERRAKHSSLRDVAGLLRSFNYAHWEGLRRVAETPEQFERLAPLARAWEAESRAAFLRSYEETARESGLYTSLASVRGLLELFELEKALYELRYELRNRPDWVSIPLQGILGLAERP
ncbi:maltose alpha-D-glucosyltransferase [Caldimonas brevitalea]